MSTRPARPRIAWMMSRFPAVSETFILQEIMEARRQGVAVEVFPLVRNRDRVVHPEAVPLVERAHYARVLSRRTLAAQAHWLRRAPGRYAGAWARAVLGNLRSPRFLSRAVVVVPLAARFAVEMQRAGVGHVHAHWATHPALAALVIGRLTGIPYTFTAHAHDIHVDRTMLRAKVRGAARVITISDFNRRLLEGWFGDDARGRVEVVRCGVDLERFPERPAAPDAADGVLRVLCVAGLRDYKGHIHLIRAVADLARRGVEVRLELIGDGELRGELEEACRREGVADRVVFRGARPAQDVADAMDRCHAFALPSVVTGRGRMEGLPVALMEAMARAVPVVTSAISGIPELVEDGVSGLLTAPGDEAAIAAALLRIRDDPDAARTMALAGSRRARAQHDIHDTTARLLAIIDEIHGVRGP